MNLKIVYEEAIKTRGTKKMRGKQRARGSNLHPMISGMGLAGYQESVWLKDSVHRHSSRTMLTHEC